MEFKGSYNLNAVFTHVREKNKKRIWIATSKANSKKEQEEYKNKKY
jgi:hypothetical protein